ncbi:MAG: hypothetical protein AB1426_12985 [Bacillota bacterium]
MQFVVFGLILAGFVRFLLWCCTSGWPVGFGLLAAGFLTVLGVPEEGFWWVAVPVTAAGYLYKHRHRIRHELARRRDRV